jgi:phosphoribosylanthranilate isomerase
VAAVARQPLVKICGVTDEEGVLAALRAGADAIGLNLVPGTPRALSLAEATYLAALAREASPARIRPRIVAVFADAPAREIEAAVAAFGPDAVQLSGNEPASTIASIRRPVWKVLHLPAAHGEPAARADGASQTAAGAAAGLADAGSAAANAVEAGTTPPEALSPEGPAARSPAG